MVLLSCTSSLLSLQQSNQLLSFLQSEATSSSNASRLPESTAEKGGRRRCRRRRGLRMATSRASGVLRQGQGHAALIGGCRRRGLARPGCRGVAASVAGTAVRGEHGSTGLAEVAGGGSAGSPFAPPPPEHVAIDIPASCRRRHAARRRHPRRSSFAAAAAGTRRRRQPRRRHAAHRRRPQEPDGQRSCSIGMAAHVLLFPWPVGGHVDPHAPPRHRPPPRRRPPRRHVPPRGTQPPPPSPTPTPAVAAALDTTIPPRPWRPRLCPQHGSLAPPRSGRGGGWALAGGVGAAPGPARRGTRRWRARAGGGVVLARPFFADQQAVSRLMGAVWKTGAGHGGRVQRPRRGEDGQGGHGVRPPRSGRRPRPWHGSSEWTSPSVARRRRRWSASTAYHRALRHDCSIQRIHRLLEHWAC
uniref:Uncharacterized protein n=1 Tax=Setaria viridis TaxID=4556 RepID=A0A4U6VLK5_SETVI|nr:hypothetical protein SEVIR_2G046101v2 [Setaria viridis]